MYFVRKSLFSWLFAGMLITACGSPAATEPTPDVESTIAANAETMVASIFQTQTASAPTATDTPLPTSTSSPTTTALALPSLSASASATGFVAGTFVPLPTGTFYTLTPGSSSGAVGCNNLRLIQSYTEPAGPFDPGEEFTQYWQVENNGTCDWVYLYHLVHASGDRMGGNPGRLSKVIPPAKWTTLSIQLEAPNREGTHTGSWRFSDAGGTPFGATLPVSIKVGEDASTATPIVIYP